MLSFPSRRAVTRLATAVMSVWPLAGALPAPVRVAGPSRDRQWLLDQVAGQLAAPELTIATGDQLDPFQRLVSDRLELAAADQALAPVPRAAATEVAAAVAEARAADPLSGWRQAAVRSPDATMVPAYAAGDPQAPPVVLVSACGMPVRLAAGWISHLAKSHLVLTWESRGLFGDIAGFDGATGVPAQVADLFAVMDHFGVRTAHLAGLCGGAVLALAAAGQQPDRVSSLSLWHGDFELGPAAPKTAHQRNLQALLAMGARGRTDPDTLHAVLCRSLMSGVPADLAHLVLYPYATPALLLRYCRLNGAIMELDVRPHLPAAAPPALVVTSRDDHTAHPDGSRQVAAALPDSRLVVTDHGDHLSLFRAEPHVLELATRFIAGEPVEVAL